MTKETIMEELTNLISIGGNILTTRHESMWKKIFLTGKKILKLTRKLY